VISLTSVVSHHSLHYFVAVSAVLLFIQVSVLVCRCELRLLLAGCLNLKACGGLMLGAHLMNICIGTSQAQVVLAQCELPIEPKPTRMPTSNNGLASACRICLFMHSLLVHLLVHLLAAHEVMCNKPIKVKALLKAYRFSTLFF